MTGSFQPVARGLALLLPIMLATTGPAGAAGELDPTFGTDGKVITSRYPATMSAAGLLVQPDGALVVVGGIEVPDFLQGFGFVTRYASDGSFDPTFSAGPVIATPLGTSAGALADVAQQADGKLVAAGDAQDAGGELEGVIVRYLADGSLDPSFGGDGVVRTPLGSTGGAFTDVLVDPDGNVVVAGYEVGAVVHGLVARYLADGSLDASFGGGGLATTDLGDVRFNGVARQSDGRLVATGSIDVGGGADVIVARFETDGTLDASFGSGGLVATPVGYSDDVGSAVLVQPDGKIVVGGTAYTYAYPTDATATAIRYLPDGTLDFAFASGGILRGLYVGVADTVEDLVRQPDGKLVLAGRGFSVQRHGFVLIRLLEDGTPDTTFGVGGGVYAEIGAAEDVGVVAIARQDDAKLVVAGVVTNGSPHLGDVGVARFYGEGSPPTTTSTSTTLGASTTSTFTFGSSTSTSTSHSTTTSNTSSSTTSSTTTSSSTSTVPGCSCANPCEVCDGALGCHVPDEAGCAAALPRHAALTMKDDPSAARDQLVWKWKGAAAVAPADFGDPTTSSAYALCVLERPGGAPGVKLLASVPASGTCGAHPCWRAANGGFRYVDASAAHDGIRAIQLKAGAAGRAKATVKGRGANLAMPPLGLTTPVTARLVRAGTPLCWEATFSAPARNDVGVFKSRSD